MNQYIRTNKHKDKNFTYNEKNEHTCKRLTKDRVVQQLEEIFFKFMMIDQTTKPDGLWLDVIPFPSINVYCGSE